MSQQIPSRQHRSPIIGGGDIHLRENPEIPIYEMALVNLGGADLACILQCSAFHACGRGAHLATVAVPCGRKADQAAALTAGSEELDPGQCSLAFLRSV